MSTERTKTLQFKSIEQPRDVISPPRIQMKPGWYENTTTNFNPKRKKTTTTSITVAPESNPLNRGKERTISVSNDVSRPERIYFSLAQIIREQIHFKSSMLQNYWKQQTKA